MIHHATVMISLVIATVAAIIHVPELQSFCQTVAVIATILIVRKTR
jgi:hypothetical protein